MTERAWNTPPIWSVIRKQHERWVKPPKASYQMKAAQTRPLRSLVGNANGFSGDTCCFSAPELYFWNSCLRSPGSTSINAPNSFRKIRPLATKILSPRCWRKAWSIPCLWKMRRARSLEDPLRRYQKAQSSTVVQFACMKYGNFVVSSRDAEFLYRMDWIDSWYPISQLLDPNFWTWTWEHGNVPSWYPMFVVDYSRLCLHTLFEGCCHLLE